jgi:hypothetical protein
MHIQLSDCSLDTMWSWAFPACRGSSCSGLSLLALLRTNVAFDEDGAGQRLRSERPGMLAVFLAPAVDAAAGAKYSWFLSVASRPDSAAAA